MTDLNKLRSEFEALPLIKEKLNAVYFDETLNSYFAAMINSSPTVKYVQGAWMAWQEKAKAQVVPETHTHSVILTCAELKEAYDFGAPDGEIDQFQMETEMLIKWLDDGYDGAGYYCWYADLPEEGCIKLGESESGAEG